MFDQLKALTVQDYQKWLRRQIRQYGRRAELGDAQHTPVESFVKEMTGLDYYLLAGGEVEVYVGNTRYEMAGPQTLAYYTYEDNESDDFTLEPVVILKAGKALDYALLEDPSLPLAA